MNQNMYILSGVLDISTKIDRVKKYFNFIKSMHFQLFCILFVSTCIPAVIMGLFLVNVVKNEMIQERFSTLQNENGMLRNYIINDNYMDTLSSDNVVLQMQNMASSSYGRIQIIDADLVVVKDTYVTDEGKTNIAEGVIKAMNGTSVAYYDKKSDKMVFAMPITVSLGTQSMDISGNTDSETFTKGVLYAVYSTTYINDMVAKFADYVIMVEIIIVLLAVILATFISTRLVRPFKNIEESIDRIGIGDTGARMLLDNYTETQDIAKAFDNMTARIEKLEKSRQEFVSNVSHELKTPITSIKVLADSLLVQEDVPVEMYREFMGDIVEEIDRENKIITDLLTLVKFDKNNSELKVESVNINELIESILKRLKPIAEQKNIELVLESFRPVVADVDELKFSSAISNLVENAVKYNVLDGWVRVSVNADHKYFYVKVSDSGIGIPTQAQEHVFERFFRVDKARDRETGGTGLGLAICQNAVLMHKGEVKVHSKEGQGTTFSVRVPLKYIP